MDELEKKANKGLESFKQKGDIGSVRSALDGMVDSLLDDDEDPGNAENAGSRSSKWYWISIAALLLAIVMYWGYRDGSAKKEPANPSALYAQYFDVLPNAGTAGERGETSEMLQEEFISGMNHYDQGNYASAVEYLEKLNDPEARVFAAISKMKLERHEESIDLFTSLQSDQNAGQYKDIVDWYLSLSYLKTGDVLKAKDLLEAIASGNHYKKTAAEALLKVI